MTNFKIHIVSDTVCPWCYVGKKRLEQGIEEFKKANPDAADTFSTTWAPFYLDPEAPKEGEDKKERYARRFGAQRSQLMQQRLAAVGDGVGIAFRFGGRTGNTRDSHRLVQLGKSKSAEVQTRVVERLFAAYFEHEQDITSRAVLLKAAVDAGLEQAEAQDWLDTDKGGPQVDAEVKEAQRRWIHGVPHFTINDKVEIEGADDPATFVDAFEKVKRELAFEQSKGLADSC